MDEKQDFVEKNDYSLNLSTLSAMCCHFFHPLQQWLAHTYVSIITHIIHHTPTWVLTHGCRVEAFDIRSFIHIYSQDTFQLHASQMVAIYFPTSDVFKIFHWEVLCGFTGWSILPVSDRCILMLHGGGRLQPWFEIHLNRSCPFLSRIWWRERGQQTCKLCCCNFQQTGFSCTLAGRLQVPSGAFQETDFVDVDLIV